MPEQTAIIQQPADRPELLVFDVVAKIHTTDIESMAHAVDEAIDRLGEVDILLIFRTFDGASLGAAVDPKAIRVSLKSNAHVRRYGVVGAPVLAKAMIELFDPLTPVHAKTFSLGELEDARRWIDASA